MTMLGRTDRSLLADWWWTVERWLLTLSIVLMLIGILLSLAASPPVAHRLQLDGFHFVKRQLLYLVPAIAVMISASMLSERMIRRLSLVVLVVFLGLMGFAISAGIEVKGAARWIRIAGFSLQPSEFAKPAFVVVCAWLFAEGSSRAQVPGYTLSVLIYGALTALLLLQPDFGQAILVTFVWGAMFFLAGLAWRWILMMASLAIAGAVSAYNALPHVAERVNRFFSPESGDTFQVDMALQAIRSGGWFGKGPGEGTVKAVLPDAHSDFVFAVAGEEFGIVVCLGLAALYMIIVARGLACALRESDAFARLAAAGLVVLFGMQALINIGVNLALLPAKGMTLPFVSYGGSSLLAVALTMGFVIGLTRRRARGDLPDQVWRGRGGEVAQ